MSAVSSDAKGITIESYGSLPSGMLFNISLPKTSPVVPAMAVGLLMPALHGARGQAKRAVSASNLSAIGKGIAMHQAEYDRFPPNLAKLVEAGYLPANAFYSPNSGRKPRFDSKGKPLGPIDYVYLGAEFPAGEAPAHLMIVYERPEINRGKGTNALFVDGHVEWISMSQFQRLQEQTQEYIKKKGGE